MEISIVVRATDPARAAEIARALGLDVKDPNRPNPKSWTAQHFVSIVVTATEGLEPGIYLGPTGDFDGAVKSVAEVLGTDAVAISRDCRTVRINGPDGMNIAVERDAPRAMNYHEADIGTGIALRCGLAENRQRISACMSAIGASDPRLVGRALGRLRAPKRWVFVVDAAADADLQPLQSILDELTSQPIEVRRSSEFDAEHLALINKKAFDVW
jgi:hypothetical protein